MTLTYSLRAATISIALLIHSVSAPMMRAEGAGGDLDESFNPGAGADDVV